MPPKKNKENPFYYFMLEKRAEVQQRMGRKVTMAELPSLIYSEWQNLSESKKQRFKDMCCGEKGSREKYDSTGIALSEIQRERDSEKKEKEEMIKYIIRTVDMLSTGKAIPNGVFNVICITHYVQTEDGSFVPAEIGLCQFSLAKGIISHFHKILPGNIPLGYKYEATQHSDQTHNLLLNLTEKEGRFREDLYQFLMEEGSQVPVVYTLNSLIPNIKSMVDRFYLETPVNVYSLDYLLKRLYSASIMDVPESITTDMVTCCRFDYVSSLPCEWHQTVAPDSGNHCALGIARRWIFNICDCLRINEKFGIVLVQGRHLPKDNPAPSVSNTSFDFYRET